MPFAPAVENPQVPPAGNTPGTETLVLGSLLAVLVPIAAAYTSTTLTADDFYSPANRVVFSAIREAAGQHPDRFSAATVWDTLTRGGSTAAQRSALMDAVTSGATGTVGALDHYAAVLLARRLRQQVESFGHMLITAAEDGSEAELGPMASRAVTAIEATRARLSALRGDAP